MSSTKWKPLTNVPEGKPLPEEEVEFILIGAGSPFVWHLLIFSPFAKCLLSFISPGLPRTGTMSTYAALEMILPGKCHHMARCWKGVFYLMKFLQPRQQQGWNGQNLSKCFLLAKGSWWKGEGGWVERFRPRRATECWGRLSHLSLLERPGQALPKCQGHSLTQILGVLLKEHLFWPDKKVLLNDRDPVRWYESVKNTVLQLVGLINGPATRYEQAQVTGARWTILPPGSIPSCNCSLSYLDRAPSVWFL